MPVAAATGPRIIGTRGKRGSALSDNIEVITRFELAFRAGDQATIDELCDPGLIDHNPAPGHEPTLAGIPPRG
jgi:hypothetical protein